MSLIETPLTDLLPAVARACNLAYTGCVALEHPSKGWLRLADGRRFNPLLDGEQAMWVSVVLQMQLSRDANSAIASVPWAGITPQRVPFGFAPLRAMWRAITQAAAAVAAKNLTMLDVPGGQLPAVPALP